MGERCSERIIQRQRDLVEMSAVSADPALLSSRG